VTDVEQIVRRAVDTITTIAGKAAQFSTKLLLGTVVVCVGSFLLGLAALSGGVETIWSVLAIVFGSIAIGAATVARWRVGAVRRHVPQLAEEVRRLVTDGTDRSRTVIETFAVDPYEGGTGNAPGGPSDRESAIVLSRRMSGFRGTLGSGLERTVRLSAAVTALTTFPLLVLMAVAISVVFASLGLIFLIALAL
jgi:hypothetical protein